jgi:Protein involved in formate dehydrogenase formation
VVFLVLTSDRAITYTSPPINLTVQRLAQFRGLESYWCRMPCFEDNVAEQAARRWAALRGADPSLTPAVELQRLLLAEMITVLGQLEALSAITPPSNSAGVIEKLKRGLPALRGEPVELPVAVLAPSLDRFCRYLADGGAGDVARHVAETFESGRMSRASLLSASLARDQRAIRMGGTQMGLSPDLLWLVGELATAPLAYILQRRMFADDGSAASSVGAALAAWDRGYCPACGSWPALTESIDDGRLLRCSFCGAAWEMQSRRCVYCNETGAAFRIVTPDPAQPGYLLELCDRCGGYTKGLAVSAPAPFPLLAIEDLETCALDRVAAECGYARPPLAELGAEATYRPARLCEEERDSGR